MEPTTSILMSYFTLLKVTFNHELINILELFRAGSGTTAPQQVTVQKRHYHSHAAHARCVLHNSKLYMKPWFHVKTKLF